MRIITIEGKNEKDLTDAIEKLISDNKIFHKLEVNYLTAKYE